MSTVMKEVQYAWRALFKRPLLTLTVATTPNTNSRGPVSMAWDTTKVPNGAQTIVARAVDATGKTGSTQVAVSVSNAGPPPSAEDAIGGAEGSLERRSASGKLHCAQTSAPGSFIAPQSGQRTGSGMAPRGLGEVQSWRKRAPQARQRSLPASFGMPGR